MAAGMRWYLRPLCVIRAPIDKNVFTVLLSLRFTSIVFEEIRNISLGLAARGVQWRLLGWRHSQCIQFPPFRHLGSLFVTSAAVANAITWGNPWALDSIDYSHPREAQEDRLLVEHWIAASVALAAFSVHFAEQV